jgi:hypothetical protein
MLNKSEQHAELLRNKPQQRTKLRPAPLLLLMGSVIILGALLVLAWQAYTIANGSAGTARSCTTCTGGEGNNGSNDPPWEHYPTVYWQTLRTQVAQGFHMSEKQMQVALQSAMQPAGTSTEKGNANQNSASVRGDGKALSDLATAQGISQNQLHAIEAAAIQQAHAVLVNQKVLTQQDASDNIRAILAMDQNSLNVYIIEVFTSH